MNGKNQRPPVTDAPVEFEECLVEGRDFKKFNHHSRGICGIYLKFIIREKPEGSQHVTRWTWKEALGSWPIMLQNLPGHGPSGGGRRSLPQISRGCHHLV